MVVATYDPVLFNDDTNDLWTDIGRLFMRGMMRLDIRFKQIEGDVAVLKTDVAVLKTDVALLKTDMAEVKTGLATTNERLDRLESTVDEGFDKTNARFDELKALIIGGRRT